VLDLIRAKISAAQDPGELRSHLNASLAGTEGPPEEAVVDEAVALCRSYVDSCPGLIEQTLTSAQVSGGLQQIAPLMEQVGLYFLQDKDLIPDHAGLLGLLDDALYCNRMLEVLSATYQQLAGVPLVVGDLGAANRAAAAFLGPQIATTIAAAVDGAVQQRVMEVQLQAAASSGFAPTGGTFEDQAGDFFARYGSEFGGSGDIDIYHNPVW
jgi:hypothetical protein